MRTTVREDSAYDHATIDHQTLYSLSRFIQVFNTDGWDTVREGGALDHVLTRPVPGTVQLGPDGMIAVWSHSKAALPDSWHRIPGLTAEGDYLANLLPTYGRFTGKPHQGVPPMGKWLEHGTVNIVRFEGGTLAETRFGMDPLVRMQQMRAAP